MSQLVASVAELETRTVDVASDIQTLSSRKAEVADSIEEVRESMGVERL